MPKQYEELRNRLISALSDSDEALHVVAHVDFMTLVMSASNCLNQRIISDGAEQFASQAQLCAYAFGFFFENHKDVYNKYRDERCGGDYMIANGPLAETLGVLAFLLILSVPGYNRLWGEIPFEQ